MSSRPGCITVLYFAAIRERLGRDREELELPAGIADVQALSRWLERTHPELRGALSRCRFAVGEELRSSTHPVEAGDVVAVIPPVSGG
ncbi:MAG TPA: molybdopterin converting factor subunit 1 [Polyangiaceae bacterium]